MNKVSFYYESKLPNFFLEPFYFKTPLNPFLDPLKSPSCNLCNQAKLKSIRVAKKDLDYF